MENVVLISWCKNTKEKYSCIFGAPVDERSALNISHLVLYQIIYQLLFDDRGNL